jgi:surface antigen
VSTTVPRIRRPRRLLIALLLSLLTFTGLGALAAQSAGATVGSNDYPYASYDGPGSNPALDIWTDSSGNEYSPFGFVFRNCTDFVAWRLNHDNGATFSDGTSGGPGGTGSVWGNGGQWAAHAGSWFNSTPAIGSVAQWADSYDGAGSFGHVAYVDSVNSDGSITIEEYNFNSPGNYDTRTITPTGGYWPSGFIHIKDLSTSTSANPVGIRIGSELYAKSSLGDGWSDEGSGSNGYWKVAGNRFAKWDGNSGLWVKDGPAGTWYNVTGSADQWSISSSLVVIQLGNYLYAKAGLTDSWTLVDNYVTVGNWKVVGSRFALWDAPTGLYVKDGMGDSWHNVAGTNTAEWAISSNLIAIRIGSELYAKSATADSWVDEGSASNGYWKVAGNRLAKWDGNSGLSVKDGPTGTWFLVTDTSASEWAIGEGLQ